MELGMQKVSALRSPRERRMVLKRRELYGVCWEGGFKNGRRVKRPDREK